MVDIPEQADVLIEAEQMVWNGRFPLQTVRFRHRRFDGRMSGQRNWELWRRGRAAAMLPYDPWADQVVLIEQFRLPAFAAGIAPILTEIPAGLCDGDESPLETINREMREEIGLAANRSETVGEFILSPGGSDECCTLYIGRVTAPPAASSGIAGHAGLDAEEEDIRIRVCSAEAAFAGARAGAFPNALTTLALLWLAGRRDQLRPLWTDR